ncbi:MULTISPECIES: M23 family metallopeptidase [Methylosinus]|uniref:M23 family peptidase n=1 Tax=Methylosinus trichosporium (strain ATCC 35070 / NCIMB 11131 / UNIQEM 75 / OB3b) TaxID=595536 RepID=A0A2D2CZG7_METT3|nr:MULTISPECIES: M23 family metallopeptidase [Methylosinus]ATQ68151.1 M23 family peptidase [Methylosinus trichosporium OB3b]OBS53419.1 peptidase M23 [Methylosinus sp. 3S-1]
MPIDAPRSLSPVAGVDWIDIGDQPAIEADGGRRSALDRRRVSVRWLAGTVLTGLSGAVLISSAAYTALDHQSRFAEAPTRAQASRRDERDSQVVNQKKGDRLLRAVDIVAAKQTFRTTTTARAGEKEVLRTRSYTHVATTLTLAPTSLADDVPPFNPLRLLADSRNPSDASVEPELAVDDAEVSFVTRELVTADLGEQSALLTGEECRAQVAEQAKSQLEAGPNAGLTAPGQWLLSRTSRAALGSPALAYATPGVTALTAAPFASIEVRMVPENVTIAPRTNPPQPTQMDEKLIVLRRGETLADALLANGVPKSRIAEVGAAFGGRRIETIAREGQRIKLLFADFDGSGAEMQLARISIYSEDRLETMVAATDRGGFLQVTAPANLARAGRRGSSRLEEDGEESDDPGAMRLYDSLYETALKQDIPRPIINELIRIFASDLDLQRGVAAGDALDILYDESEEGPGREALLYASITSHNETLRYYRYQTTDDGLVDYYDESGRSSRKFLVRKPIAAGETRSGFGMRRHPILGYYKMHTGVDWAAPIGTPILAAGNGLVIQSGWHSGYGRRVEIQHANGYVTAYSHMSGFARGIREGVRVRQGQLVGFLGSSGLSTGPHLHYEVMVNGHFVDPMRVRLARTREFDGRLLADFKRERDRIDTLIAKAPNSPRVSRR